MCPIKLLNLSAYSTPMINRREKTKQNKNKTKTKTKTKQKQKQNKTKQTNKQTKPYRKHATVESKHVNG